MLDGPIFDFIRVSVVDGMTPSAIPTLTEVGILGTTPGKGVRDSLRVYYNATQASHDFDPADPEYGMIQKVFAQGRYGNRPRRVWVWNVTRTKYRLASLPVGSVVWNNAIVLYAQKYGEWGDRLRVRAISGSGTNVPYSSSVDKTLILNFPAANADLKVTQTVDAKDIVAITFVDPQKANQPFKIEVQNERGLVPATQYGYTTLQGHRYYNIVVYLATNNVEEITTTAQDVVDALTNAASPHYNAFAASLIDIEHVAGSDGSGLLSGKPTTMIPISVTITLPTDADGNLAYKANQLVEAMQDDNNLAGLFLVRHGSNSAGTGTAHEIVQTEVSTNANFNPNGIVDDEVGLRLGPSDNVELAMEFTPTTDQTAQAIKAVLKRFGTIAPGRYVWFEIQGDAAGVPDGNAIGVSAKVPASSISPAAYQTVTFEFPRGVALTANTTYHIVFKGDYDPSPSNYIAVATDVVASGGAGEIKDATWSDADTMVFAFRLYKRTAEELLPLSRLNTPASGLELVRAYNAWKEYARVHKLEMAYFILCTSREDVPGDTQALSDRIAADVGIYITTNRADETAEQIKARIDQLASPRTGFIAHTNPAEHPDAVLAGIFVSLASDPIEPGNFSLFWKVPNTLTPAEWTSTELTTLYGLAPGAPGAIVPVEDLGNRFIAGSWATDGSFLDWTWKKDRIRLEVTMGLFNLMKNTRGITYDGAGIAIIENTVRRILQRLTKKAFIGAADSAREHGYYSTDFPKVWEVDETDFQRRVYKASVRFQPAWQIEQIELTMYASFNPALAQAPQRSL